MDLRLQLFILGIGIGLLLNFSIKSLYNLLKYKTENNKKASAKIIDSSYDYVYIHEAGHAFLAHMFCNEYFVEADISKDKSPCVTYSKETCTKDDVKNLILICYAGAAAEEVILGEFSAGSIISNKYNDSDFVKCVDFLKAYILLEENNSSHPKESRHSKTMLDSDFNDLIVEKSKLFYNETLKIIEQNKKVIIEFANLIKKKRQLSKDEIDEFLIKKDLNL